MIVYHQFHLKYFSSIAGNTHQKTEVFKLIVIAVLIVAVVIIISACISLAITFSRIHKEKNKTTEPICHYGEISNNDENSLEEFENQQEPFYSTPYAHGVLHLIKPTKRNGTIYDASTRIHPDRGCKIHRDIQRQLVKTFCCEGYKEENDICVECPECTSMICPHNYCGETCIEMCNCPDYAYCDKHYCCLCRPGLRGVFCNETCTHGFYGPRCQNKCTCQTLEKCDHETGNCNSNTSTTSTICLSGKTCTNNVNNSANNLLHDGGSKTSGNQQVTVAFKFIVIVVIIGGAMIIIIAFISCAISCARDGNVRYIFGDAQTTETLGHYVDINPNDELSQDEIQRLQEPFRPLPSYANDVNQPLQLVQRNSIINNSNTTYAPTISNIDGAGYIHKCLSLPILSYKGEREAQNKELTKLQSRSCDQLLHASICIAESDYLNPHCSLLQSGLTGSDYLNPYTTLLKVTDKEKQITI
ncbi:Hypothetical predicted protein [Mytilus galloprovincialis]|uniref:EGF-like domain-containing protein n=1 Tax=Mytilus galloprovincialis TaxID=29158 RepID=A0A8B6BKB1_MYTGA|nr:Hypothetical predicted protein [Mytilus galloprovincialis]